MTIASVIPTLFIPLIGWRLYRRIRKSVGKQHLHVKRLWAAIILLPICLFLVGTAVSQSSASPVPLLLGGLTGIGLAFAGLKLTQFHDSGTELSYTPNPYLGTALILLLVARIIYRFWQLLQSNQTEPADLDAGLAHNPTGIALFGAITCYYTFYSAGLLRQARKAASSR